MWIRTEMVLVLSTAVKESTVFSSSVSSSFTSSFSASCFSSSSFTSSEGAVVPSPSSAGGTTGVSSGVSTAGVSAVSSFS